LRLFTDELLEHISQGRGLADLMAGLTRPGRQSVGGGVGSPSDDALEDLSGGM
jgi:hypothetical protein